MNMNREEVVNAVVAAAGGKLASRVRLQKSVFLLEQLGLNSGFDFEYYHYGPYSRELDNATSDATAFELLTEETERRKSDGAPYSIFISNAQLNPEALGELSESSVRDLMKLFVATNVTVLELATTVFWLITSERRKDWRSELVKRKGVKASEDRVQKAISLLQSLNLIESHALNHQT